MREQKHTLTLLELFFSAIDSGDVALVGQLLDEYPILKNQRFTDTSQENKEETGLMRAIFLGKIEIVKKILSYGPDLNIKSFVPYSYSQNSQNRYEAHELTYTNYAETADNKFKLADFNFSDAILNAKDYVKKKDEKEREEKGQETASKQVLPSYADLIKSVLQSINDKPFENFKAVRKFINEVKYEGEKDSSKQLDLLIALQDIAKAINSANTDEEFANNIRIFFKNRDQSLADDGLDHCNVDSPANNLCRELERVLFPGAKPFTVIFDHTLNNKERFIPWASPAAEELPIDPSLLMRTPTELYLLTDLIDYALKKLEEKEVVLERIWCGTDPQHGAPLGATVYPSHPPALTEAQLIYLAARAPALKELIDFTRRLDTYHKDRKNEPNSLYERLQKLQTELTDGSVRGQGAGKGTELFLSEAGYKGPDSFALWWHSLTEEDRTKHLRKAPGLSALLDTLGINKKEKADYKNQDRSDEKFCAAERSGDLNRILLNGNWGKSDKESKPPELPVVPRQGQDNIFEAWNKKIIDELKNPEYRFPGLKISRLACVNIMLFVNIAFDNGFLSYDPHAITSLLEAFHLLRGISNYWHEKENNKKIKNINSDIKNLIKSIFFCEDFQAFRILYLYFKKSQLAGPRIKFIINILNYKLIKLGKAHNIDSQPSLEQLSPPEKEALFAWAADSDATQDAVDLLNELNITQPTQLSQPEEMKPTFVVGDYVDIYVSVHNHRSHNPQTNDHKIENHWVKAKVTHIIPVGNEKQVVFNIDPEVADRLNILSTEVSNLTIQYNPDYFASKGSTSPDTATATTFADLANYSLPTIIVHINRNDVLASELYARNLLPLRDIFNKKIFIDEDLGFILRFFHSIDVDKSGSNTLSPDALHLVCQWQTPKFPEVVRPIIQTFLKQIKKEWGDNTGLVDSHIDHLMSSELFEPKVNPNKITEHVRAVLEYLKTVSGSSTAYLQLLYEMRSFVPEFFIQEVWRSIIPHVAGHAFKASDLELIFERKRRELFDVIREEIIRRPVVFGAETEEKEVNPAVKPFIATSEMTKFIINWLTNFSKKTQDQSEEKQHPSGALLDESAQQQRQIAQLHTQGEQLHILLIIKTFNFSRSTLIEILGYAIDGNNDAVFDDVLAKINKPLSKLELHQVGNSKIDGFTRALQLKNGRMAAVLCNLGWNQPTGKSFFEPLKINVEYLGTDFSVIRDFILTLDSPYRSNILKHEINNNPSFFIYLHDQFSVQLTRMKKLSEADQAPEISEFSTWSEQARNKFLKLVEVIFGVNSRHSVVNPHLFIKALLESPSAQVDRAAIVGRLCKDNFQITQAHVDTAFVQGDVALLDALLTHCSLTLSSASLILGQINNGQWDIVVAYLKNRAGSHPGAQPKDQNISTLLFILFKSINTAHQTQVFKYLVDDLFSSKKRADVKEDEKSANPGADWPQLFTENVWKLESKQWWSKLPEVLASVLARPLPVSNHDHWTAVFVLCAAIRNNKPTYIPQILRVIHQLPSGSKVKEHLLPQEYYTHMVENRQFELIATLMNLGFNVPFSADYLRTVMPAAPQQRIFLQELFGNLSKEICDRFNRFFYELMSQVSGRSVDACQRILHGHDFFEYVTSGQDKIATDIFYAVLDSLNEIVNLKKENIVVPYMPLKLFLAVHKVDHAHSLIAFKPKLEKDSSAKTWADITNHIQQRGDGSRTARLFTSLLQRLPQPAVEEKWARGRKYYAIKASSAFDIALACRDGEAAAQLCNQAQPWNYVGNCFARFVDDHGSYDSGFAVIKEFLLNLKIPTPFSLDDTVIQYLLNYFVTQLPTVDRWHAKDQSDFWCLLEKVFYFSKEKDYTKSILQPVINDFLTKLVVTDATGADRRVIVNVLLKIGAVVSAEHLVDSFNQDNAELLDILLGQREHVLPSSEILKKALDHSWEIVAVCLKHQAEKIPLKIMVKILFEAVKKQCLDVVYLILDKVIPAQQEDDSKIKSINPILEWLNKARVASPENLWRDQLSTLKDVERSPSNFWKFMVMLCFAISSRDRENIRYITPLLAILKKFNEGAWSKEIVPPQFLGTLVADSDWLTLLFNCGFNVDFSERDCQNLMEEPATFQEKFFLGTNERLVREHGRKPSYAPGFFVFIDVDTQHRFCILYAESMREIRSSALPARAGMLDQHYISKVVNYVIDHPQSNETKIFYALLQSLGEIARKQHPPKLLQALAKITGKDDIHRFEIKRAADLDAYAATHSKSHSVTLFNSLSQSLGRQPEITSQQFFAAYSAGNTNLLRSLITQCTHTIDDSNLKIALEKQRWDLLVVYVQHRDISPEIFSKTLFCALQDRQYDVVELLARKVHQSNEMRDIEKQLALISTVRPRLKKKAEEKQKESKEAEERNQQDPWGKIFSKCDFKNNFIFTSFICLAIIEGEKSLSRMLREIISSGKVDPQYLINFRLPQACWEYLTTVKDEGTQVQATKIGLLASHGINLDLSFVKDAKFMKQIFDHIDSKKIKIFWGAFIQLAKHYYPNFNSDNSFDRDGFIDSFFVNPNQLLKKIFKKVLVFFNELEENKPLPAKLFVSVYAMHKSANTWFYKQQYKDLAKTLTSEEQLQAYIQANPNSELAVSISLFRSNATMFKKSLEMPVSGDRQIGIVTTAIKIEFPR